MIKDSLEDRVAVLEVLVAILSAQIESLVVSLANVNGTPK